ncbi:MAG: tetratricopeptide repeat protein [Lachnospiraceae bacterium]
MRCYNCGCDLTGHNFCTNCKVDVTNYKLVVSASNLFYNDGLEKARVRDLTGAVSSLRQCLKLNKNHVDARNLLGLVYFELGESVQALNEWVISKNLQAKKNVADDYLNLIQSNPGKLDALNATIKKFNQALTYCYQGSLDLAVIQLKKVLSMNPKYLQAHQLLALLYLQSEEWTKARKELDRCLKIDINNTIALRYTQEIDQILGENGASGISGNGGGKSRAKIKESGTKSKSVSEEAYQYQSGNETIIQPYKVSERRAAASIGNLIIGICIGLAVAWFLILPARIQNAKAGVNEEMKAVSEQLDVKSATISELESKVKVLESEKQKLEGQLEGFVGTGGTLEDVNNLLQAVRIYMETPNETVKIGEYLEKINPESVSEGSSESFTTLYDLLIKEVGPRIGTQYYEDGMDAYQSGNYQRAIDELTRAVTYDETNSDALFNLGNAYRKLERDEEAIQVYERVIELFPTTEKANRAQSYINELTVE